MTLMSQLFSQAQDLVTVALLAAGLIVFAPWLILLLLVALVPAFLGEAHFNAQSYSLDFGARPSGASSTMCARPRPAPRPPRK
jgi:ATP-binding cassette subfamily B protein